MLSTLNHPNIVSFNHIESDENYIYLIMEFLSGGTLKDQIQKRLKNSEQYFTDLELSTIMKNIALAVDFLHSVNIYHRDIKLG